jgi:hypothetical protein
MYAKYLALVMDTMSGQELDVRLDEQEALLEALPDSLPAPPIVESIYSGLLNFSLDPEWEQDVGAVGAVNHGLEVIWGSRAQGLSIKERGHTVQAVVGVLRSYMHLYPDDVILEKWLEDLKGAAKKLVGLKSNVFTFCSSILCSKFCRSPCLVVQFLST